MSMDIALEQLDFAEHAVREASPFGGVTVSVVSHGQGEDVRALLEDLDASEGIRIDRVIVTRNIAEPDFFGDMSPRFQLEVVDNAAPKGYGANHNAAFARCISPWFLVLNPDLRIDRDALGRLLAQALPSAGVLAPRILEPGKTAPEPHRRLLTPFEIMGRWFRPDYQAPKAEWVAGMFMLFRAGAFAQVGGFDEKFFMYVEDADICARLRLAGWEVAVNESAAVLHKAQRASDRQWRALAWHWQSLFLWWFSEPFWRLLVRRN